MNDNMKDADLQENFGKEAQAVGQQAENQPDGGPGENVGEAAAKTKSSKRAATGKKGRKIKDVEGDESPQTVKKTSRTSKSSTTRSRSSKNRENISTEELASAQNDDMGGDISENSSPIAKNKTARGAKSRGKESAAEDLAVDGADDFYPLDYAEMDGQGREDENSQTGDATERRDNAETSKRKNRRGKRGGRGRSSPEAPKAEDVEAISPKAQIAVKSALQVAMELLLVPALPPAESEGRQVEKPASGRKKAAARVGTEKGDPKDGKKRMFISVVPGEQVEVALAEDGRLLEYYLDMLHLHKIKGNIYKGIIHNIDTNLQAAFVNYGAGKNGFLQIDQIHPEYWQSPHETSRDKKFPPIQKAIKTGQEILVQVVKEPAGSKGAFLTTWLSLAGRFLVLTPGQEQIGVSRKVTAPDERKRLREMMNGIDPGAGLGVIVRTVGEGATKTTLKTDLQYLKRLWKDIRRKATEVAAPALIHQEPGLSERSVRDYLTDDVREIWVDNEEEAQNVRAMANLLFPRKKDLVRLHTDINQSIWDRFNLGKQLDQIYSREVALPSGGRLVFDQTEALMAIDINSGKISGKNNFESMAFKTNMEAAEAIARQLRLRDIGGQVVIDFIEMRDKKHILEVEKTLRQAMKNDRARHEVARMSSFGLLELVRQRMGSSALSICMETCQACGGTGLRRNLEWQALQTLRHLRQKMRDSHEAKYIFEASRELGMYLLNYKRDALRALEDDLGKTLEIRIQL